LTAARIGLARTGASLATSALLDFRLAHARARDAVHAELDESRLIADLKGLGLPVLTIASEATHRSQYLIRPDLGRSLATSAIDIVDPHARHYDVAFVVTEGLSAGAGTNTRVSRAHHARADAGTGGLAHRADRLGPDSGASQSATRLRMRSVPTVLPF
jgi:ethanolamine ammonia-lyase small subunit